MLKIEMKTQRPQGEPTIWCPVFYCDWCQQKIEKASQGMCQFWMRCDLETPINETLVTTHNGECNHAWEAATRKPGYLHGWWPLKWFVGYLSNNLEVQWSYLIEEYCPDSQLQTVQKAITNRKQEAKGK